MRPEVVEIVRTLREYSDQTMPLTKDDLKGMYSHLGLTDRELSDMHYLIEGNDVPLPDWENPNDMKYLAEGIEEGLHCNLDGWDEMHKLVIELYINDLCTYVHTSKNR